MDTEKVPLFAYIYEDVSVQVFCSGLTLFCSDLFSLFHYYGFINLIMFLCFLCGSFHKWLGLLLRIDPYQLVN